MLSGVSRYSVWASAAAPRLSDRILTVTCHCMAPLSISNLSPLFRLRAGLARSSFQRTLPDSIASAASERVLKKRAAHSHLSMRTVSLMTPHALTIYLWTFHRQRHTHAAADTQAGQTAFGGAPDHFVQQGHQHAATRGADRMTDRNRAAVDV